MIATFSLMLNNLCSL